MSTFDCIQHGECLAPSASCATPCRLEEAEVFLCRASGEGSHNFRVCTTEDQVHKFYAEMFGEDVAGEGFLKSFRDPDEWAMGVEYCEKLYNARFEVWKVDDRELSTRSASVSTELDDAKLSAALHENAAGQLAQMVVDSIPSATASPSYLPGLRLARDILRKNGFDKSAVAVGVQIAHLESKPELDVPPDSRSEK